MDCLPGLRRSPYLDYIKPHHSADFSKEGSIMPLIIGIGMGLGFGGQVLSPGLPLDNLTSAAAYSTRRLRTAYTGPLLRVRRSSDNTEADIGYGADGWLDEASLLAHVGAGDGFVTTWYDQSGNGRDATQTTAGHQPNIVNAGVVRPAPDFDGVDDDMRSTVGAIGSNCEIMVATNDGVYFQDGCRFTDVASHLRLPHSGNLLSYVVLDTSFTAAEKSQIATYFGFAAYTDAQWILSTRTVTNPKLRIDTTGSVTWSAVWSGGSATGLATGAERTLTMAGYRGLIVITTTGGAAITRSDSGTNLWANTLSDLPAGLAHYNHHGSNTVSGSLADLPAGLTLYAHSGNNTVSGSLADLPSGVTFYSHGGQNTVSGSLADLPYRAGALQPLWQQHRLRLPCWPPFRGDALRPLWQQHCLRLPC
jgi:hypothetical protein